MNTGGNSFVFQGANWDQRHQALAAYRRALRNGLLRRGPCAVCGVTSTGLTGRPIPGHHEDYAKPFDVIWLCPTHHAQRHMGQSVEEMRGELA